MLRRRRLLVQYDFTAKLWRYGGESSWYFITLPKDYADEIKEITKGISRGFKSVRIEAQIGGSIWKTSIFPDNSSGSYVLPVKKQIRIAENIDDADKVKISIKILGM